MDRNFSTNELMDRASSKRTIALISRGVLTLRPPPEPLSRSGSPLHPRLIGLGAPLLIAALATDLAYANSLLFQWENFSIWLLAGGLLLAALAGLAVLLDIVLHRITGIHWVRFSGFSVAALLSLLNALVHSRDAYTAVVPEGLALSAIVSVILVIIGWRGWSVSARQTTNPIISEEAQ